MNASYYALAAAMVSQARLDLRHRCWPSGCKTKNDCQRRKLTARHFLSELRTGRSPIWSDWLALAANQANVPRVWRS